MQIKRDRKKYGVYKSYSMLTYNEYGAYPCVFGDRAGMAGFWRPCQSGRALENMLVWPDFWRTCHCGLAFGDL